MRGAMAGYENALYKKEEEEWKCFNQDTTDRITKIVKFLTEERKDLNKVMILWQDAWAIGTSMQDCSIDAFLDVYKFCSDNNDSCSPTGLMMNSQKNMFVIMGKFSDLS